MSKLDTDWTGARFSPDRVYREILWRWVEPLAGNPKRWAAFIMLNPSKANETENDLTITKCLGYAARWDRGGIVIANLWPVVSTDPAVLATHPDPLGPHADQLILEAARKTCLVVDGEPWGGGLVVCAWGAGGALNGRAAHVLELLRKDGHRPMCLGLTKDGYPRHPSRLAYATPLEAMP